MKVSAASAAAAVLIALVASAQSSDPCNTTTCYKSGTTKTPPTTATTPTRLPVKTSTPAAKTTYAKDHAHTTAAKSGPAANGTATATSTATTAGKAHHGNVTATTAAANVTHAAVNATTSKPATLTEGHVALKQKLNSIAVRCKDELHAPQEIMALVSNTVVPQNEQQRCYLECVYKALNLIKNNKFSVADGKKLAQIRFAAQPEEHKKAVTIIETCEKEVIVDPKSTEKCSAGRVIRNCFVKNGEKINFFPKA